MNKYNRKLYLIILFIFLFPTYLISKSKSIKLYSKTHGREIEVAENEIIVKFRENANVEKINNLIIKSQKKIQKSFKKNIKRIKFSDNVDILKIIELYKNQRDVIYAEPNYVAQKFSFIPNDPLYNEQWGLNKIEADKSWDIINPKRKAIVALVDSGVDFSNLELSRSLIDGYDFVNDDNLPEDDNGHGTHCAGIIAAEIDNGIGIAGVLNSVSIMPLKVLDKNGVGFYSDIAEAIIYAADQGANVINLSLGGMEQSHFLQEAIDYAYEKGCIIIAAAGNLGNSTPIYPAALQNVIAVGATDENDFRWYMSSFGNYLDIVAPGVNILSTYLGNTYKKATGTSVAAAFVSAISAFIISNSTDIKNYEIENIILNTADDLGNYGKDEEYGYGRINMLKAIKNTPNLQHDLSITKITVSSTNFSDKDINIYITLMNQGKNEEKNVEVKTIINEKETFSETVNKIKSDEKININIKLSQDISSLERLIIKSEVLPVEGEIDIEDNKKSILFRINYDSNTKLATLHEVDVHSYIIEEALKLWPNNTSNELYLYKNELHRGAGNYSGSYTYSEDGNSDYYGNLYICSISVSEHFWDPYNQDYVAWWNLCSPPYSPSTARTRALYIWNNYSIPNYSTQKNKAYYYLGRVIHLLQDMSVPAHVVWDQHTPIDKDTYESIFLPSNYYNYKATGSPIIKSDINSYFESMAKTARKYPSDDYDGYSDSGIFWYNNNGNLSTTNGNNASLNNTALQTIASDLMISVIQHVAGALKLFAETVDNTPPSSPANLDDGVSGWSRTNNFSFSWSASTDNLSGVKGYYYSLTDSTPDNDDFFTKDTSTTIINIPDGIWNFYVSAVDNSISQNISQPSYHTFMIDTTSPTIINNQTGDDVWQNSNNRIYNIDFEDLVSELNKFQIKITTGPNQSGREIIPWTDILTNINSQSYTNNWQIPDSIFNLLSNGTSYISIRAYDNAGNYSELSDAFYIKKDTIPPNIINTTVQSGAKDNIWQNFDNQPVFNWNALDDGSGVFGHYIYFGTDPNGISFNYIVSNSFSSNLLSDGTYYLRIQSKDNASNLTPWITIFTFKYESTKPTTTINLNGTMGINDWYISDVIITLAASDTNGSGIKETYYKINGGETQNYTSPFTISSQGIFTIEYWSIDNAGNEEGHKYINLKIDKTNPTCYIKDLPNYIKLTSFTIEWNGFDGISGIDENSFDIQYKINSQPWIDWFTLTNTTYSVYGPVEPIPVTEGNTYSFRCRVKDKAGNISEYSNNNYSIIVDTSPPNITSILSTTHPENVWKNISDIVINYSANDSISGIERYGYQISNSSFQLINNLIYTYNNLLELNNMSDGIWYFYLLAVDKAGNYSNIATYGPIKIDTTSPQATVTLSKHIIKQEPLIINIIANEDISEISSSITQNGSINIPLSFESLDGINWSTKYIPITNYDGTAIFNATVKDVAGNSIFISTNFIVDTTSPTAVITMDHIPPFKTGEIKINLTINDLTDILQKPFLKILLPNNDLITLNLIGFNKTWSSKFYIESTTPQGVAYFIFSATDTANNNGIEIISGDSFTIDTTINNTEGGSSSNSDGTSVYLPPYSTLEPVNIIITDILNTTPPIPKANDKLDIWIKPINIYKKFTAIGEYSSSNIKYFQKDITISIPYLDENQDGYVDNTNIKEKTLKMFHLNELTEKWEELITSQVIETENKVIAKTNTFSIYALFSISPYNNNTTNIIAFPNPCYIKKDGYVRITNLPQTSNSLKIFIYTIAGELVRILNDSNEIKNQSGIITAYWDGYTENGKKAASGVYIYVVKDNSEIKKREKIVIFW
ncbi:MAG: S8 family serine peptidase [Elusimicrobiales bacterium]|nr:S8 family serine peptidase [Elusimicrobiales bacterium]